MRKYIDLSMSANGTGSKINPYNSFFELNNNISGNQNRDTWLIKSGGVLTAENTPIDYGIFLKGSSAVSNLTIGMYEGSIKPVIDGSLAVTTLWIKEGELWYTNLSTANERAIIVSDYKLHRKATKSECAAKYMSMYYDNANDRHYINIQTSPTGNNIRYTELKSCILATGCDSVTVVDVVAKYTDGSGIVFSASKNGNVISNCEAHWTGGWSADKGPGDGFIMYGPSDNATPARDCGLFNNYTIGANNNIQEYRNCTGLIVENNFGEECSMGFEFWGYIKDSFIRYNKVKEIGQHDRSHVGHGNLFWLTNSTQQGTTTTGRNTNNVFAYNIGRNVKTHVHCQETSDGNKFYNNVFHGFATLDDDVASNQLPSKLFAIALADNITVKNNMFLIDNFKNSSASPQYHSQLQNGDSPAVPTIFDNNLYFNFNSSYSPPALWKINDTNNSDFAAYKTLSGQEANGINDVNPNLTDPDNWNYSITPTSPAYKAGVSVSESYDLEHVPAVGSTPNIGVSENRDTAITKSNLLL